MDSNIKKDKPNDFDGLYKEYPNIKHIFFNGTKAYDIYIRKIGFDDKHTFKKLPSTSPAHAVKFEYKLEKWKNIMKKGFEKIVDNTIDWAMKYLDSTDYSFKCLGFVKDALELSNNIKIFEVNCAKESADIYQAHKSKGIPPKGSFVYYDCIGSIKGLEKNWGHVGLAIDDGLVLHTWDKIRINHYREIETLLNAPGWTKPKYIGWVSIKNIMDYRRH